MEAFFMTLVLFIAVNVCSARKYATTSTGTTLAIILGTVLPTLALIAIVLVIVCVCYKKCGRRMNMGVSPFAAQMALAQYDNPYAPPGFNQPPPPPPPYGQAPYNSTSIDTRDPQKMAPVA